MGHLMCAACFTHLLADGRYVEIYLYFFIYSLVVNWRAQLSTYLSVFFFFIYTRLRDQVATCPNCRVEISKSTASRNLAVEKAVSELPNECQFCGKEYPSKSLERHEKNECDERPTNCKYHRIGCQWKGPVHEGKYALMHLFGTIV